MLEHRTEKRKIEYYVMANFILIFCDHYFDQFLKLLFWLP